MTYLPDTSVILRLNEPANPVFKIVEQCFEKLREDGEEIVLIPQVLIEFWVVATRPKSVNGQGLTVDEAEEEIQNLQQVFTMLAENEKIFDTWKTLVTKYKVSGKVAHDARIVAAMIVHGIDNILTLNPSDFKRYTEINAVSPLDL